jgi:hypothetical protein
MAASQLEHMRLLHEELEALEGHAVEVLEQRPDAVSASALAILAWPTCTRAAPHLHHPTLSCSTRTRC